jgi:polyribonucleotide nucleotidyltransferase
LGFGIALVAVVLDHGPSIISPHQSHGDDSHEASEPSSLEFLYPSAKVVALIGSKGSNVFEIHQRTGCRVQVLQETSADGSDKKVLLTGNPQQIKEAKALITQLISNGAFEYSSSASSDSPGHHVSSVPFVANTRTIEVAISPEKLRLVIGAKGVTIGEIMKRSGCKVYINQNFSEGQDHLVVYSGTPQQVDVAKYLVETVINQGMSTLYGILNGPESIAIQEVNIFEPQLVRLTNDETVREIEV